MQLARLGLAAALCLAAFPAGAVLIRADRDDAEYLELATRYGACVPLAHEGEGVLVASRWILTSARVANGLRELKKALPPVVFAGIEYEIREIVAEDDLALIRVARPVTGVAPIPVYRASDESGKPVVFVGHGRSGKIGAPATLSDRRARGAINTIDRVAARTLTLEVKTPDDASDLQGALAGDEMGAPAILETKDGLFVAGIARGLERANSDRAAPGDRDLYARVAPAFDWIEAVMVRSAAREAEQLLEGERR